MIEFANHFLAAFATWLAAIEPTVSRVAVRSLYGARSILRVYGGRTGTITF